MKTIGINRKSFDIVIDGLRVVDIRIKSTGYKNNNFLRVGSQSWGRKVTSDNSFKGRQNISSPSTTTRTTNTTKG
jgi:hypothetical protein